MLLMVRTGNIQADNLNFKTYIKTFKQSYKICVIKKTHSVFALTWKNAEVLVPYIL